MRISSLILLAGVVAVGCSSGSGDNRGSGGGLGERYCVLFKPCCQKAGLPDTQQTCRLLFDGAVAKDQAAAEACIQQYEAWAQEPDWCETFGTKPRPESCEKAYPDTGSTGTQQPGEPCEFNDDCAQPSNGEPDCYHDFDTDTDYCRVLVKGTNGAACVGTRDDNLTVFSGDTSGALEVGICDRADGLYCDDTQCASLIQLGQSCSDSMSCAGNDTYCSSTCQSKVPPGSSCADSSSACAEHAYCEFESNTCLATLPTGAACSSSQECDSSYCESSGTCSASNGLNDLTLTLFCN